MYHTYCRMFSQFMYSSWESPIKFVIWCGAEARERFDRSGSGLCLVVASVEPSWLLHGCMVLWLYGCMPQTSYKIYVKIK
jgi:hypothetical protein